MAEIKKQVHVMIDLETLGLQSNATVLSIGAVCFNSEVGVTDEFYAEIDPTTYPGVVDFGTLKFWFKEVEQGSKVPINGTDSLNLVLMKLDEWFHKISGGYSAEIVLWANGTDFDIPKLYHMYAAILKDPQWKYSNVRDARTLYKLFGAIYGIKPPENTKKHHALEDARWQANWLISILSNLEELIDVSEL